MARVVVIYDNWASGPGEFGVLGAEHAPKNAFSATNLLVNRSGQLYVRPGIRNLNPSGIGSGAVIGMGDHFDVQAAWYVQSNTARKLLLGAGAGVSNLTGTFGSAPANVDGRDTSGSQILIATGSGVYNLASGAVTKLTDSPNSTAVAIYGDRIVAVDDTFVNVLKYSDAANPNSWPAGNTITVGDATAITAIFAQRSSLLIMKGLRQQYVLTGVPGVNDTLRQVSNFSGPAAAADATRTAEGKVWFRPKDSGYPVATDGVTRQPAQNLPFLDGAGVSVFSLTSAAKSFRIPDLTETMLWDTSGTALVRQRGVWTRHEFGVALANSGAAVTVPFYRDPASSSTADYGNVWVCNDGTTTPILWGWCPDLGRPGSETVVAANAPEKAGDNSTTQVSGSVEFPEQRADDWATLQATRVMIDFTSWKTGGASTSHFDAVVRSTRQWGGTTTDSATQSWDLADASSSTAGTHRRVEFGVGDQGRGGGVQVFLSNMRGVSISRVSVLCETFPLQ